MPSNETNQSPECRPDNVCNHGFRSPKPLGLLSKTITSTDKTANRTRLLISDQTGLLRALGNALGRAVSEAEDSATFSWTQKRHTTKVLLSVFQGGFT